MQDKKETDKVLAVPDATTGSITGRKSTEPVIDRAVIEDDEAFSCMVQATSPRIYRFLCRMTGSAEDALDLTQEVFLAAHNSRSRFRIGAPALPYLMTIARRKAVSLLRWRAVRRIVLPLSELHHEIAGDETQLPPDKVEEQWQLNAIQSALAKLRPVERAAVVLRLFEERSYDEIAQVMGKPLGTVRSLVFRAERKLREHLKSIQE
ncbi:MAG: RNA polymerase sigma factor [bacterium]